MSKKCLMQPGRIVGLDGAGSVLLVSRNEHGLQSVPAWVETEGAWCLAFGDAPSSGQGANDICAHN